MGSTDALPAGLALAGALLFGLSAITARMGLRHGDARLGSLISIGTTAAFYWALFPFYAGELIWEPERLWRFVAIFAAIALVSPSISLFLSFEGTRRLGPTVSGTFAATAPLWGAGSAVLVLGERMTPGIGAGTLAIVAGVMVLSWQGRGRRDWPLWAALFPIGAAMCRGGIQMSSKFGFAVAPAPFTAMLVTATVSFVAVGLAYRLWTPPRPADDAPERPPVLRSLLRGGLRWFVLTGLLTSLAFANLYSALNLGRVVVVSPMVSTYPLFTFGFSLLFRVERLTLRIFAGVVLVIAGVVAVSTQ